MHKIILRSIFQSLRNIKTLSPKSMLIQKEKIMRHSDQDDISRRLDFVKNAFRVQRELYLLEVAPIFFLKNHPSCEMDGKNHLLLENFSLC